MFIVYKELARYKFVIRGSYVVCKGVMGSLFDVLGAGWCIVWLIMGSFSFISMVLKPLNFQVVFAKVPEGTS